MRVQPCNLSIRNDGGSDEVRTTVGPQFGTALGARRCPGDPHFRVPAQAEDLGAGEIRVGTQLVCNTQHEAFRFVKLYSGDAEAALRIVNAEGSDPRACDIVPVLYFVGPRLGSARTGTRRLTSSKYLSLASLRQMEFEPCCRLNTFRRWPSMNAMLRITRSAG